MRGDLVSRPIDEVLIEAEKLVRGGVKELLVVSQDTSAYGVDVKYASRDWRGSAYETRMTGLCEGLAELGIWVRLHYVYPYPHVDDVIPLMADGKILPYLDIPFQHASPRILKLMKRPGAVDKVLSRVRAWRNACPDLTIRIDVHRRFSRRDRSRVRGVARFPARGRARSRRRVRVFAGRWCKGERVARSGAGRAEAGAPRALHGSAGGDFGGAARQRKIGTRQTVLVDEVDADGAIARSKADAPEIDGIVRIDDGQKLKPGQFADVTVIHADEHDLIARLVPQA